METNPSLENEFYIAHQLGMTVSDLRQIGQQEYLYWEMYFARRKQNLERQQRAKTRR